MVILVFGCPVAGVYKVSQRREPKDDPNPSIFLTISVFFTALNVTNRKFCALLLIQGRIMLHTTDPADPNRCQGASKGGQCLHLAEPGQPYCAVHGKRQLAKDNPALRQYRLANATYRDRAAQLSDSNEISSLRDEIALARLLIETRFNSCRSDVEVLANIGAMNQQFLTLERLCKTFQQLQESSSMLLDKAAVQKLGQKIVEILYDELQHITGYEEIVDRIMSRLSGAIGAARNVSPGSTTTVTQITRDDAYVQ
jgi:hypothetical protein